MELLEKRLKKLNSIICFRFTQLIFRTINELLASLLLSNDNGSLCGWCGLFRPRRVK
ncbi:hypothetical protein [Dulcicalothrix desertica]|uniref:hypothetical protein n=1 Tax=Dulcicalothrix desertica TaxID=32056 RepID=UPI001F27CEF3|nr:hypothetical protein [Dulcicalothrix desertica]